MKLDPADVNQRLEILQIITDAVVHQENDALRSALSRCRTKNVQWVLNTIKEMFTHLQDALEMQDYSNYLDEG
jgi:hypothetical protein